MPYNRQIPDSPIPGSMFPRAETLTDNDIVVIIQPLNAPGDSHGLITRTENLT